MDTPATRRAARIAPLRQALLDLHKAMLDAQRVRYERVHGRIETSGEFLGRVLHHPEFEWMRALSALIAQLDEWSEEREGSSEAELAAIMGALQALVQRDGGNPEFSTRYWEFIQDEPQVTMAHVKVTRMIDHSSTQRHS